MPRWPGQPAVLRCVCILFLRVSCLWIQERDEGYDRLLADKDVDGEPELPPPPVCLSCKGFISLILIML